MQTESILTDPTQSSNPEPMPYESPASVSGLQGSGAPAAISPSFDLSSGLATNFGAGGSGALAFSDSAVAPGYIEWAPIQSRFRFRYDDMAGANDAARATYFYPTPSGPGGPGPIGFGGLTSGADNIDIREGSFYAEFAFSRRFSLFFDIGYREVGPINFNGAAGATGAQIDRNIKDGNQNGISDTKFGLRAGLIAEQNRHLTFQLRAWAPTGEPLIATGVGHSSIDFSLLYDKRLSDDVTFYAEINDWVSLEGGDINFIDPDSGNAVTRENDANVLRLGAGLGFDLWKTCGRKPKKLTALFEVVGWEVLDGYSTDLSGNVPPQLSISDATGDTIINGKYGARFTSGSNSIYAGYGHNWTSKRWYADLFRIEYQRLF